MKENIIINGTQNFMGNNIPVVCGGFGENKKCMSDKTIAKIHGMREPDVRRRIVDNIKRFKENVDFIDLMKGVREMHTLELLRNLGYAKQSITQAEHIYILSERGYSKLIKIMDTDLAWEIHDKLMDEYFEMREIINNYDYVTHAEVNSLLLDIVTNQNVFFDKLLDMQKSFCETFNSSMLNFTNLFMSQQTTIDPCSSIEENKNEIQMISTNNKPREYRNEIFELCKKICELSSDFDEPKHLLSYCYKQINKNYGVVWDQERKDYYNEYGYYPKSLITMISEFGDNRHYKSILKTILQDIYNNLNKSITSPTLVKSSKLAYTWDEAQVLVKELARYMKDNSPYAAVTYNRIYKMMDNGINWSYYRLKYKKLHNITSRSLKPNKKEIIGCSNKLQSMFITALNNKFQEVGC